MSKKMLGFMVAISLALIIVSLYFIKTLDPGEKPKPVSDVINVTSLNIKADDSFKLTYSTGEDFTFESLKGKYSIIYFGFANCPDICPATLSKMQEASEAIGSKDNLQFIFVSIDPERDSNENLTRFISNFGTNIKAVSGEKDELDKLVTSLKVYYAKADGDKDSNDYYVDHSSFVYLLNPEGSLITQFSAEVTPKNMANEIEKTLQIEK